jgi:hypothetical protein
MSDFKKEHLYPSFKLTGVSFALLFILSFLLTKSVLLSIKNASLYSAIIFIGAHIPDLDCASIPSRIAAKFIIGLNVFTYYQDGVILFVNKFVHFPYEFNEHITYALTMAFVAIKMSKHRGFTHKLILSIGFGLSAFIFTQYWMIFFIPGILMHQIQGDRINLIKPSNWV